MSSIRVNHVVSAPRQSRSISVGLNVAACGVDSHDDARSLMPVALETVDSQSTAIGSHRNAPISRP